MQTNDTPLETRGIFSLYRYGRYGFILRSPGRVGIGVNPTNAESTKDAYREMRSLLREYAAAPDAYP